MEPLFLTVNRFDVIERGLWNLTLFLFQRNAAAVIPKTGIASRRLSVYVWKVGAERAVISAKLLIIAETVVVQNRVNAIVTLDGADSIVTKVSFRR